VNQFNAVPALNWTTTATDTTTAINNNHNNNISINNNSHQRSLVPLDQVIIGGGYEDGKFIAADDEAALTNGSLEIHPMQEKDIIGEFSWMAWDKNNKISLEETYSLAQTRIRKMRQNCSMMYYGVIMLRNTAVSSEELHEKQLPKLAPWNIHSAELSNLTENATGQPYKQRYELHTAGYIGVEVVPATLYSGSTSKIIAMQEPQPQLKFYIRMRKEVDTSSQIARDAIHLLSSQIRSAIGQDRISVGNVYDLYERDKIVPLLKVSAVGAAAAPVPIGNTMEYKLITCLEKLMMAKIMVDTIPQNPYGGAKRWSSFRMEPMYEILPAFVMSDSGVDGTVLASGQTVLPLAPNTLSRRYRYLVTATLDPKIQQELGSSLNETLFVTLRAIGTSVLNQQKTSTIFRHDSTFNDSLPDSFTSNVAFQIYPESKRLESNNTIQLMFEIQSGLFKDIDKFNLELCIVGMINNGSNPKWYKLVSSSLVCRNEEFDLAGAKKALQDKDLAQLTLPVIYSNVGSTAGLQETEVNHPLNDSGMSDSIVVEPRIAVKPWRFIQTLAVDEANGDRYIVKPDRPYKIKASIPVGWQCPSKTTIFCIRACDEHGRPLPLRFKQNEHRREQAAWTQVFGEDCVYSVHKDSLKQIDFTTDFQVEDSLKNVISGEFEIMLLAVQGGRWVKVLSEKVGFQKALRKRVTPSLATRDARLDRSKRVREDVPLLDKTRSSQVTDTSGPNNAKKVKLQALIESVPGGTHCAVCQGSGVKILSCSECQSTGKTPMFHPVTKCCINFEFLPKCQCCGGTGVVEQRCKFCPAPSPIAGTKI